MIKDFFLILLTILVGGFFIFLFFSGMNIWIDFLVSLDLPTPVGAVLSLLPVAILAAGYIAYGINQSYD